MIKLKALVIDDEEDARELIKIHLSALQHIEILGEAANGLTAVEMIEKKKPDLVFLDIEMPELNGLEVIKKLRNMPHIIFVTAFNEYAVNAFEIHAVDYLLKPFTVARLNQAIERVRARILADSASKEQYMDLFNSLISGHDQYLKRISVKSNLKTHFVAVQDIILLEASDQYVSIQTLNESHLVRGSMEYFEKALDPKRFIRTHRSYIVSVSNVLSIEQYDPHNLIVHLKGAFKAKLSQSRKLLFENKLKTI